MYHEHADCPAVLGRLGARPCRTPQGAGSPWWTLAVFSRPAAWTPAVVALVLLSAVTPGGHAWPHGATAASCVYMTPGHGYQPWGGAPYKITVTNYTYEPGQILTVSIPRHFKGLLLQAREPGNSQPLGRFLAPPSGIQFVSCSGPADTLTHADCFQKHGRAFQWQAPAASAETGDIEFIATITQSKDKWWRNVRSLVVKRKYNPKMTTKPTTTTTTQSTTTTRTKTTTTTTENHLKNKPSSESIATTRQTMSSKKTVAAPPAKELQDRKTKWRPESRQSRYIPMTTEFPNPQAKQVYITNDASHCHQMAHVVLGAVAMLVLVGYSQ